jgi:hypothetical protein
MHSNNHIENYLDYYLKIRSPKFAVAITGDWGAGKTFFIKNYFNEWSSRDANRKYHYITLNGLSSFDDIDSELFASMHPILSNKKLQMGGRVVKGLMKGVLKIDLDESGNATAKPSIDFKIKDIENASNPKNNVYIFDDLERCKLSPEETLGYINYIVEHQGCSVVVIAEMNKFNNYGNEGNTKKNGGIVEKTIGQQFTIRSSPKSFYDVFVSEMPWDYNDKRFFFERRDLILDEFKKTNVQSLRILGLTIRGLYRISLELKATQDFKYEWLDCMLMEYVHLSSEYNLKKNANVFEAYNKKRAPLFFRNEEVECEILKGDYAESGPVFLSIEQQKLLIIESIIDKNYLTSKLMAQLQKKDSSWFDLYNIFYSKPKHIESLAEKEIQKIKDKSNRSIGSILHVTGSIVHIESECIINLNFSEIYNDIKRNIVSLTYEEMSLEPDSFLLDWRRADSFSGYMYRSIGDDKFTTIQTYANDHYKHLRQTFALSKVDEFFELMINSKIYTLNHILLNPINLEDSPDYDLINVSFLNMLDIDKVVDIIIDSNMNFAMSFTRTLSQRVDKEENGEEVEWFERFKSSLQNKHSTVENSVEKWFLDKLITSLSS